jgi:HipA-like protein
MQHKDRDRKIIAVDIFLEKRKTMVHVGSLTRQSEGYKFVYKKNYLYAKGSIPVGNELPITQKEHFSATLFSSLSDRIPSRENPSYVDYCRSVGISENETDVLVLLSTIGRRGPSSFIFEPVYEKGFDGDVCKKFRTKLGLTIREFAGLFDISTTTLRAIENKSGLGKEALKRLEIYYKYPDVALDEVFSRGGSLRENKRMKVIQILKRKIQEVQ